MMKKMMKPTRAQSVNRYIEQVYTYPCAWAVFPHGTVVLLTPPALVPQTLLALRAREVLLTCGIERGAYDGIKPLHYGGYLVEFASKFHRPRGVQILGVFPSLDAISSRGAIEDTRCAPLVVNCNPGEFDEEGSDDEDSDIDLSDDTGVARRR